MAEFAYDAINAQGLLTSGIVSAPDVGSAREQLQARGLLPSRLAEKAAAGEDSFGSMFKKVKPKSLQIFARQLATMIEAGVSVVAALVTLEEQTDDKYLKEVVAEVRGDVESGMIFSRALGRHPKVFNRLFCAMVAAGESSGTLDTVLDRVATQIEKETKLKRRVKGAMIYPAVVLSFATLVLIFMLMFIVPVFQKVFDELNGQLPTPTRIIIAMSQTLRGYWFIIFPMIGLIIYLLRRLKRTPEGVRAWDRFKLRVPLKIGDVVQKVALARISRTLATLVAAGVDIITALDITAGTSGNWVPRDGAAEDVGARARGCADQRSARRGRHFPADGQPDGEDRRGDGRARQDAQQDRRLLRGRGRLEHCFTDVDHRAAADDLRGSHGGHHRHLDVPADVQAPHVDQVARR